MKILTKITLLVGGLALAALPFVSAADNTAAAPASVSTVAGPRPHLRALAHRRLAVGRRAVRRAGLNHDQASQLKSLRTQTLSTVRGIRTDSSLTRAQKRAKTRATLQGARTDVRGVLTADQKAHLQQLRAQRRALRGVTR